jgi:hypothetical protein
MVPKSIRKIVEKGTISIYTFVLHIEWQNLVYKRKGILIFFLVKNARDSYLYTLIYRGMEGNFLEKISVNHLGPFISNTFVHL